MYDLKICMFHKLYSLYYNLINKWKKKMTRTPFGHPKYNYNSIF